MWVIELYRANGRFVRQLDRPYRAKYAAKKKLRKYEETYDEKTYFLEIRRYVPPPPSLLV